MGIEPTFPVWKTGTLTIVLYRQFKYAYFHKPAYFLKVSLLADIVVGMVGFEPTQPEGTRFTVSPSSPTLAHTQTTMG